MELHALTELEEHARRVADQLDPALLSGEQAARTVATLGRVARIVGAMQTLAAGRVADTAAWKSTGEASSAHWLARQTGTSVAEAVKVIQTGERLHRLPATRDALRNGELSPQQAHLVADAAAADPAAEGSLLELAGKASLRELQEEALRTRAAAEPNEMARHEAVRRSRHFRHRVGPDGAFLGTIRTTVEAGALLLAAIAQQRPAVFDAARRTGERAPAEAYDADALIALAANHLDPTAGGPSTPRCGTSNSRPDNAVDPNIKRDVDFSHPVDGGDTGERPEVYAPEHSAAAPARRSSGSLCTTVIRVDHAALLRGHSEPGELCEISGVGPVPVAIVRGLLGHAFLAAATVDSTGEVHRVAHLGRSPTVTRALLAHLQHLTHRARPAAIGGLGPPAGSSAPHRSSPPRQGSPPGPAGPAPPIETLEAMGSTTKVIIRVAVVEPEHGPSPREPAAAAAAAAPCCDQSADDPILAALQNHSVDVAALAHRSRKFRAHQRTALELRDHSCSVLGCATSARLEIDHRDDWARTRHTATTDADRYCHFHHALKTRYGWHLEPGTGKRRMLPPEAA